MSKVQRERDRGDDLEKAISVLLLPGETIKVVRNRKRYIAMVFVNGER